MSSNIVKMTLQVPVQITKSENDKWYVSCCPVFGVNSQGKTEKKALDNLGEALYLFFLSCIERGTFDAVMKESGFSLSNATSRVRKNDRDKYIDVPLHFSIPKNTRPSKCHA